jgi:hypothetical protein
VGAKSKVSLHFPPEPHERVRQRAGAEGVAMSDVFRRSLEDARRLNRRWGEATNQSVDLLPYPVDHGLLTTLISTSMRRDENSGPIPLHGLQHITHALHLGPRGLYDSGVGGPAHESTEDEHNGNRMTEAHDTSP